MFRRLTYEISRIWRWLHGKRSEISQLTYKDAFMAHLVLEIMQTIPAPSNKTIPLYAIDPIHPVDNRDNTVKATKEREKKLEKNKARIIKTGGMTKALMAELMPSLTYVRVVPTDDDRYYCFEGNGRIAALKAVFSKHDQLSVEVDVFLPKKSRRSIKKIEKLRKLHKMV